LKRIFPSLILFILSKTLFQISENPLHILDAAVVGPPVASGWLDGAGLAAAQ
jgi:hypothetical protein